MAGPDELTNEQVREHLEELAEQGLVERHPDDDSYRLTAAGNRRAQELVGEDASMEKFYLDQISHGTGLRDPHTPVHPIDGGRRRRR